MLCPVRVGGVPLTQHKTKHRSIPNVSGHIRWSLDLRYSHSELPTGRQQVPGSSPAAGETRHRSSRRPEEWLRIVESANVPAGS